jgi:hypothetical protein
LLIEKLTWERSSATGSALSQEQTACAPAGPGEIFRTVSLSEEDARAIEDIKKRRVNAARSGSMEAENFLLMLDRFCGAEGVSGDTPPRPTVDESDI